MPAYLDKERGTYYCKFYYTDWTGKTRQKLKRGFTRKKDAKDWERTFLDKHQGTADMTFESLVELYLEHTTPRIKEDSLATKKGLIDQQLLPYFGKKAINKITPADVIAWQTMLQGKMKSDGKPYSSTHLRNIERQFVSIMSFAVRYYGLRSNPHNTTGYIGKAAPRKMDFWTREEFHNFLETVTDPAAHLVFNTLFYAGLRVGELLALTAADIDLTSSVISITKTYVSKNKKDKITTPKSHNSVRKVAISPFLLEEYQQYMARIFDLQPDERLFPYSPDWVRRQMVASCKRSGTRKIRIHDIRHSHVSLLIDLGFSPILIAERIGDTVDMVNQVYGHLYPNRHAEVANRLQDLVSK